MPHAIEISEVDWERRTFQFLADYTRFSLFQNLVQKYQLRRKIPRQSSFEVPQTDANVNTIASGPFKKHTDSIEIVGEDSSVDDWKLLEVFLAIEFEKVVVLRTAQY